MQLYFSENFLLLVKKRKKKSTSRLLYSCMLKSGILSWNDINNMLFYSMVWNKLKGPWKENLKDSGAKKYKVPKLMHITTRLNPFVQNTKIFFFVSR